ncbi:FadR/GntR family transcriptional regulator [Chelatococcus asaccharovorans]|uniref:DNA-binding FadR family transcriptional regulator n=1 Tax=Chelatococcus asaccharovorans TaxID=28210 RepID=A0A2V3TWJ3_9HYPH|nr:FadR/GntR family transcriptional regulator [Chelatococcus asaccharovorans]MBS7705057.1 FadR family transcriptional regulator [Chelatococcus asaccharovorans]PXW53547.1 DNA-binding FadR family transcriptional regulator [Chelatococcus asaccharovorans]CAH1652149.1 DNA-binding FadR family transcriptional regulator [Chelatococcus asaccharovorans]CAH1686421.1 DNA-binding FadR family transcriptional regulator [Chelatococcus asaccharovorans]
MTDFANDATTGDAVALSGRLAIAVYEQIERLIRRGEFPKGVKLPPESELARRFGVSRPVVREALARLREEGIVRSQQGSGTFVIRGMLPSAAALPQIKTLADLLRYYEYRIDVEAATAGLAAERRTADDIAEISKVLAGAEEMLRQGEHQLLADANFAFHRAVAQATRNPFYVRTLEMMPNFIGRNQLDLVVSRQNSSDSYLWRIYHEHIAIFEAIAAADGVRARAEMQRHILAARDVVLNRQSLLANVEIDDRTT